MGLDMYAYTAPAHLVQEQQVDLDMDAIATALPSANEGAEPLVNRNFAYWRKFNHLHGWMKRLYRAKGGSSPDFNCDTVRLMPEDIDQLEADLDATLAGKRDALPATSGFFFGGGDVYPEDIESLRSFIARSRQAFSDGLAVIYSSWW